MILIKPSYTLNEKNSKIGINEYDIIGLIILYNILFLSLDGAFSLVPLIVVTVAALSLIKLRFKQRRGIIRDYLYSLILNLTVGDRVREFEVIDEVQIGENLAWVSNSGVMGLSFRLQGIDEERDGEDNAHSILDSLISRIPQGFDLLLSQSVRSDLDGTRGHARHHQIREIGSIKSELTVCLTRSIKPTNPFKFKSAIHDARVEFEKLDLNSLFDGLGVKESFVPRVEPKIRELSLLKLESLSPRAFDFKTLSQVMSQAAVPVRFHTRIRSISQMDSVKRTLRQKKSQADGKDKSSAIKYLHAENTETEIELKGKSLFYVECHIECAPNEIESVKRALKPLGQFNPQLVGENRSRESISPMGAFHRPLVEIEDSLPGFLPLIANETKCVGEASPHEFAIHRKNHSVHLFSPFSSDYDHFSGLILGKSGSGKSSMLNSLIHALSHDESMRIILVDVKGSHSRLVRQIGGREISVGLGEVSNINPLNILNYDRSEDTCLLVAGFLESLILEEGEERLSLEERAKIESAVLGYNSDSPSLSQFISAGELPRKDAFKRWSSSGVYRNLFGPTGDEKREQDRLVNTNEKFDDRGNITYFNFKDLHSASNAELTKSVLGAVMLEFHSCLHKKQHDERVMFIVDEVAFFISIFHRQFEFLSRNLRKLNGGVLIASQDLTGIEYKGDHFLAKHTDYKFLFELNETIDESLQAKLNIDARTLEKLKSIKTKKRRVLKLCSLRAPGGH